LGIYEREEPKSDEVETEKGSEEKSDEEKDDDDESGEDEERDDPIGGPSGLVAEPSSVERGDVDEAPVPSPVQNEVSAAEQPLAVAVVQPEESSDPVVPIIVEENAAVAKQTPIQDQAETPVRKQKPKTEEEEDDEDEDDDEDDDDDDDDARSEKVHRHRARSAYNPSPVLYYYPFPEAPTA